MKKSWLWLTGLTFADAVALIGNIGGAPLIAMSQHSPQLGIAGYLFFTVGGVASIYLLQKSTASTSLTVITIYFMIINIIGIITRIYG